jgi:predicted O-methyltransferase YrrM
MPFLTFGFRYEILANQFHRIVTDRLSGIEKIPGLEYVFDLVFLDQRKDELIKYLHLVFGSLFIAVAVTEMQIPNE